MACGGGERPLGKVLDLYRSEFEVSEGTNTDLDAYINLLSTIYQPLHLKPQLDPYAYLPRAIYSVINCKGEIISEVDENKSECDGNQLAKSGLLTGDIPVVEQCQKKSFTYTVTPVRASYPPSTLEGFNEGKYVKGITARWRKLPSKAISKSLALQNASNQFATTLSDLPLEVFETLITFMDGKSFHNLSIASDQIGQKLTEALSKMKIWKFWRNQSIFNVNHQFLWKLLASYDNLVEAESRRLGGPWSKPKVLSSCRDDFSWEDLFYSFVTLTKVIKTAEIEIVTFHTLEHRIKDEITISYEGVTRSKPLRFTGTSGTILYNVISPCINRRNPQNLVVFEDMNVERSFRVVTVCPRDIGSVKVMNLPSVKNPSDNSGPPLPKAVRILITACPGCINLVPLQEGHGARIVVRPNRVIQCLDMDPIVEVYKDLIVIWGSPIWLVLYRISMSSQNHVQTELLNTFRFTGMGLLWNYIVKYPKLFLTTLQEELTPVALKPEEIAHYQTAQLPIPEENTLVFKVISFKYGVKAMPLRNTRNAVTNNYPRMTVKHPMYYSSALELISSMFPPGGSTKGYDMFVFWSQKTLAVSFDTIRWNFMPWDGNLGQNPKDLSVGVKRVSNVEVISPGCIMVAVDGDIVLASVNMQEMKKNPSGTNNICTVGSKQRDPKLELILLRRIYLELLPGDVSISHFSFDFETGQPYIFMEVDDDLRPQNGYTFVFRKIIFKPSETNKSTSNNTTSSIQNNALIPIPLFHSYFEVSFSDMSPREDLSTDISPCKSLPSKNTSPDLRVL